MRIVRNDVNSVRAAQKPGSSLRAFCVDVGFGAFLGRVGGNAEIGFCISKDSLGFYGNVNVNGDGLGFQSPGFYGQQYAGAPISRGFKVETTEGGEVSVDVGPFSVDATFDSDGNFTSIGKGIDIRVPFQVGTFGSRVKSYTASYGWGFGKSNAPPSDVDRFKTWADKTSADRPRCGDLQNDDRFGDERGFTGA